MRVLLIQSDAAIQDMFAKSLLVRGAQIDCADTSQAAIAALLRLPPPDVVVWDMDAPNSDQQALLETLESDKLVHIQLVVMSSVGFGRRGFARLARANHVLLKPFSFKGLVALVAALGVTTVI